MALDVKALGRLEVSWQGAPVSGLTLRKSQMLLVYLALTAQRHDRSHLAGLLWGDLPETNARRNLRHALHTLRSVLDARLLDSDRLTVGLNPEVPCRVDVQDFEAALARAGRARRTGESEAAIGDLAAAVALYRDDFLAGFDMADCLEFEEWVASHRARLRIRFLEALDTLVTALTQRGVYRRALRYARRLLALEPLWETSHRQVMTLLALTGQRSAALTQYRECRRILDEELGLEPLEETTALYRAIQNATVVDSAAGHGGQPARTFPALPFVGREAEHATLVSWWEAARHGNGQLALVEGEAGVGKTRLLEEVLRYAEAQSAFVLRGRCYEFGDSVPYQPVAEALRGYRPVAELALSPVWLAELARLLPELHRLPLDLAAMPGTGGEAARQRLFDAVARFLLAAGEAQPVLCLFLDDLHWADQSTLDLLHYLVRHLVGAPIWLVGTYRPEEVDLRHPLTRLRQSLSRDRRVARLELGPLSGAAVRALANHLVGEQAGDSLGQFLYRESEGNPFILVETMSALQEEGALAGRDALLTWAGAPAGETLPPSVQDVVLRRVGRLSKPAQRLLTLAAVIGQQFEVTLLRAAARHDYDAVDESLDTWLERRLVRQEAAGARYDFSHDKIRAVLYHTVAAGQRRRLHRRVGEALERIFASDLEAHIAPLAYHWEQAGEPERATAYLIRAGDQAQRLYAHQEAIAYYRRALAILREQGADGQARAAQTLMKLGAAYHNAFDFSQAQRVYTEGFALWQQSNSGQAAPEAPPAPPFTLRRDQTAFPALPSAQTLRVRWLEPTTLDPSKSPDNHTSCLLAQLFSGLVALSPRMGVVPDVAHAWEISQDGRHYTFHLRADVRWTDGGPVTAWDFEYAWKRTLDPTTRSPAASFLHDIKGAKAYHQGGGSREAVGVHAPDATTLVVELERPTGYFLQLLVRPDYYPVPRHVVEAQGTAWTEPEHFVTNGPFRLEAWQRGERMVLVRNPAYHGRFQGNVQRVETFPLVEWEARLRAYESDAIDVLGIAFFPEAQRQAARQRHPGEYAAFPSLESSFLVFDMTRPPFADPRVRHALTLATNRHTLADDVMQGYVSPASGGLLPQGMPGHAPGIGLPYDPDRARLLLAEAGYPHGDGFPALSALAFSSVKARTDYLQVQWRDVLGVEVAWRTPEWGGFITRLKSEPQHLIYAMWVADYPDPDNFMRVSRAEVWPAWQDARYERLVAEAGRVLDQRERMTLYRQAEEVLVAAAPLLPLTYESDHLLLKPWVRHYPMTPSKIVFWKDVTLAPRPC